VLHQVGVSFDLYYDARKHKIKKKKAINVSKIIGKTCLPLFNTEQSILFLFFFSFS